MVASQGRSGRRGASGFAVAIILAVGLLAGCDKTFGPTPPIEIYFSPKGGATDAVVRQLNQAKTSVLVQAYSFTSVPIAKALVAAHRRGVAVQVILDRSQRTADYSSADFLAHSGIPVLIDARHEIAHNKVMIVDGQIVVTGSFNFTGHAESSNAENLLVIHDPDLAAKYTGNWREHASHSESYLAKGSVSASDPPKERGWFDRLVGAGYVSTTGSSVFHKPGCKSVANISASRRIEFVSRAEAVQAGKRPCRECKP